MKKKILILFVMVAILFSIAAVKPPRLVRLEVVNKSGEPVIVYLQGVGYDFDEGEFVWHGGSYWRLPYQDPPMNAEGDFMNVPVTTYYTIPKDLYEISVGYEQEMNWADGQPATVCMSNWVPVDYVDDAAYFSMNRNRRLVIPACDVIPKVLPGPKNDVFKWTRWLLVVK